MSEEKKDSKVKKTAKKTTKTAKPKAVKKSTKAKTESKASKTVKKPKVKKEEIVEIEKPVLAEKVKEIKDSKSDEPQIIVSEKDDSKNNFLNDFDWNMFDKTFKWPQIVTECTIVYETGTKLKLSTWSV